MYRKLRVHRGAITPLQRGSLRRHRYAQALGNNHAMPYRLFVWSWRTAGRRELNKRRREQDWGTIVL